MITKIAMTKNLRRLMAAVHDLMERPVGVEGMGMLWGIPGEGKSESIGYVAGQVDGILVEASDTWSPLTMLQDLGYEMDLPRLNHKHPMFLSICDYLKDKTRPIFIDEAERVSDSQQLDILRSIYDRTKNPLIFVGMEDFARKILRRERFARRITQWIHFTGIDLDDARAVAETACRAKVADDLLVLLHKKSYGNIARIRTGLTRIDELARKGGLETVAVNHWGDHTFFSDQPNFKRGK